MSDVTLPNLFTAAGLASGLVAIFAALHDMLPLAVTAVMLALLLDRLDGAAARALGQTSELGARLDSFADLVSFGVAPTVVVVAGTDHLLVEVAAVLYGVAAAWRLARFHEQGVVTSRWGPAFVGMPTPAAAVWLLLGFSLVPATTPALLVGAAAAMVSTFRYPKGGPLLLVTVGAIAVTLGAM